MSVVRHTKNFTYYESSQLGKGATAIVYRGIDKRSGEEVAVKDFHGMYQSTPGSASFEKRQAEFELLKKVDHPNIVKVIAIERDLQSNCEVLITELCRGQSLYDLLRQPKYANGFEDKEVLAILQQVTNAVRHMREKNIIHRDLKPANILKDIAENGDVWYKVTDFGTARELDDEQEFHTLCGTEAYLHPNIYAKAFVIRTPKKPCVANVDLWSIGVSLYHIVTGSLPFRTFKPKDRETMYDIISKKESGVISGVQETAKGEIKWQKELPETCLLSPALRNLVTPVIAGLLECDETKIWSFDDFFRSVDNVLSHKQFHLFYVNTTQDSSVYLPSNATLADIRDVINEHAKIPPKRQLLLWNGSDDFDLSYVNTTEDTPILVIDIESNVIKADIGEVVKRFRPSYPDFNEPVGHWLKHLALAKQWTLNAYSIKRCVDKCTLQTKVIHSIVENISKQLETKVRNVVKNKQSCCVILNLWKQMFDYIKEINKLILEVYNSTNDLSNVNGINISKVGVKLAKLTVQLNDIEMAVSHLNEKTEHLKRSWNGNDCNKLTASSSEANAYCDQLCSILNCIDLHVYSMKDAKVVNLEKLKFENKFKKLFKLLHETCLPLKHSLTTSLEDYFPEAMCALETCEWLSQKINDFTHELVELQRCLTVIQEEQKSLLNAAQNVIEKEKGQKCSMDSALKQMLDSFLNSQEALSAQIQESQNLAAEINTLSVLNI